MKKLIALIITLPLLISCGGTEDNTALGTLERDRITFLATSNEIIRALPIQEGYPVEIGDVLVKLDDKNQLAIVTQARAQVAQAKAHLLRLTNGERPQDIAAAQAAVDNANASMIESNKTYQRTQQLVKQKLASMAELDKAQASRDSANANYHSTIEELSKLTAGSRLEDVAEAQASLQAAQAQMTLQQQKLDELTITATRAGILDKLPYHLGERVPNGALVAVVLGERIPYARIYIPASARLRFPIGSEATIHIDGISEALTGKVRWVSSNPAFTPYYALTEDERSRLMYLTEIDLPESALDLPSGIGAQLQLNNGK